MANVITKVFSFLKNFITKDEPIAKVYMTKDYSKFVFKETNRGLDHVAAVISSIIEYGLIPNPIICTTNPAQPGKLLIMDGQHRFSASMQLNLPIFYIVIDRLTDREMIALNLVSKNWTARNYIDFYATLGKQDYIIFKNMLTEYPEYSCRSWQYMLQLSTTMDHGLEVRADGRISIPAGNFKCRDTKRSLEIVTFLNKVKAIENGRSKVYKADLFVAAIVRLFNFKPFDPDRAIKKMETYPFLITKQPDATSYIDMMENIYNYRQKSGGIVSFGSIKFNK